MARHPRRHQHHLRQTQPPPLPQFRPQQGRSSLTTRHTIAQTTPYKASLIRSTSAMCRRSTRRPALSTSPSTSPVMYGSKGAVAVASRSAPTPPSASATRAPPNTSLTRQPSLKGFGSGVVGLLLIMRISAVEEMICTSKIQHSK